jgi:hypothetical protein
MYKKFCSLWIGIQAQHSIVRTKIHFVSDTIPVLDIVTETLPEINSTSKLNYAIRTWELQKMLR